MTGAPHVLLVEDSPDDVELALRAFERYSPGQKVSVASDGEEALSFLFCEGKHAERDPLDLPHLVLLDINLPKLTGIEVLERLRGDRRTALLPIVVLTTSYEPRDVNACYECGANSYVRKPVNYSEFEKVVGQLGRYWLELNKQPG